MNSPVMVFRDANWFTEFPKSALYAESLYSYISNHSVDGMVQVFIPEGSFRMGGLDVKAEEDEKPDHAVSMSAFWMDKLEVTNAMYMLCVQEGACEPHRFLPF